MSSVEKGLNQGFQIFSTYQPFLWTQAGLFPEPKTLSGNRNPWSFVDGKTLNKSHQSICFTVYRTKVKTSYWTKCPEFWSGKDRLRTTCQVSGFKPKTWIRPPPYTPAMLQSRGLSTLSNNTFEKKLFPKSLPRVTREYPCLSPPVLKQ